MRPKPSSNRPAGRLQHMPTAIKHERVLAWAIYKRLLWGQPGPRTCLLLLRNADCICSASSNLHLQR